MPAVHDHLHPGQAHRVEIQNRDLNEPATTPDPEVWQRQVTDHLLRDLEARRLPEALALREQIQAGEALGDTDRDALLEMIRILDQALETLEDGLDLSNARQRVAQLCDEILTHAHLNTRTEQAAPSLGRLDG